MGKKSQKTWISYELKQLTDLKPASLFITPRDTEQIQINASLNTPVLL